MSGQNNDATALAFLVALIAVPAFWVAMGIATLLQAR